MIGIEPITDVSRDPQSEAALAYGKRQAVTQISHRVVAGRAGNIPVPAKLLVEKEQIP